MGCSTPGSPGPQMHREPGPTVPRSRFRSWCHRLHWDPSLEPGRGPSSLLWSECPCPPSSCVDVGRGGLGGGPSGGVCHEGSPHGWDECPWEGGCGSPGPCPDVRTARRRCSRTRQEPSPSAGRARARGPPPERGVWSGPGWELCCRGLTDCDRPPGSAPKGAGGPRTSLQSTLTFLLTAVPYTAPHAHRRCLQTRRAKAGHLGA